MSKSRKVYVVVADESGRHGTYGATTTLLGVCFSQKAADAIREKYLDENKSERAYLRPPQSYWTAKIHCVEANKSLDEILSKNYE